MEEYSSLVCLLQNILLFCCYFTRLLIACDVWLTCKGICERHKALRPANGSGRRYYAGQKRCAMCVRTLSSGTDCGVHVVAPDSAQSLETQQTEEGLLQWIYQMLLMIGIILCSD